MKRRASIENPSQDGVTTRSKTRKLSAATKFAKSPVLQGMALVLKSGFLYRNSCHTAAQTCKDWATVWEEQKQHLPEYALFPIEFSCTKVRILPGLATPLAYPSHLFDETGYLKQLTHIGLTRELGMSRAFVRGIFDKIQSLNIDRIIQVPNLCWEREFWRAEVFHSVDMSIIIFHRHSGRDSMTCALRIIDGNFCLLHVVSDGSSGETEIHYTLPYQQRREGITMWEPSS